MNNREHINKWLEYEKAGIFDLDVNPVDWDDCYPVTEDFPYVQRNIFKRFTNFLKRKFVVAPFCRKINKHERNTIVVGRENLKGIKRAILTCNHVYIFDCLAVKYAVKHKMKFVAAEFNNRKGFLGDMMRAEGIMPLSAKLSVQRKFAKALGEHLKSGHYVLFYPEQAMWYQYDKPRPLKNGAFRYAEKFDVPVVPTFITYRDSGQVDSDGVKIMHFTVHILKPIFPPENMSANERAQYLKERTFSAYKDLYERTYGKPLEYKTEADSL